MDTEIVIKMAFSVLCGAMIGLEREYHSKAAGFRTITMISLGSTLLTVLSFKFGGSDRVAANILTGIGFIGAGVIFKDNLNVSGLTTAASIWVAAAIGMAIGISEYFMAGVTLAFAIVILALFERIQDFIGRIHQVRTYKVVFVLDYEASKTEVEEKLAGLNLSFKIKKSLRTPDDICFFYLVSGSSHELDKFTMFLVDSRTIKSFDE